MTTPRVEVPADTLDDLAFAHGVPVRTLAGLRYFRITKYDGSVVRVVATRPDAREAARRQTAEFMATLPTQRAGGES